VLKDSTVKILCAAVTQAIKKERLRQNLSMNALAERAGLSQQMVSYIERGMRNPTLDTLFRLSIAMEIDLFVLIKDAVQDRGLEKPSKRTLPSKKC